MGPDRSRFVDSGCAGTGRSGSVTRSRPHRLVAPGALRLDRPSTDTGGSSGLPARSAPGCRRAGGGVALAISGLRRALGPTLVGCGALRRHPWFRGQHRTPPCLAVSGLCDPGLQCRHALSRLHPGATGWRSARSRRRHGIPGHGLGASAGPDRSRRHFQAPGPTRRPRRNRRQHRPELPGSEHRLRAVP